MQPSVRPLLVASHFGLGKLTACLYSEPRPSRLSPGPKLIPVSPAWLRLCAPEPPVQPVVIRDSSARSQSIWHLGRRLQRPRVASPGPRRPSPAPVNSSLDAAVPDSSQPSPALRPPQLAPAGGRRQRGRALEHRFRWSKQVRADGPLSFYPAGRFRAGRLCTCGKVLTGPAGALGGERCVLRCSTGIFEPARLPALPTGAPSHAHRAGPCKRGRAPPPRPPEAPMSCEARREPACSRPVRTSAALLTPAVHRCGSGRRARRAISPVHRAVPTGSRRRSRLGPRLRQRRRRRCRPPPEVRSESESSPRGTFTTRNTRHHRNLRGRRPAPGAHSRPEAFHPPTLSTHAPFDAPSTPNSAQLRPSPILHELAASVALASWCASN